MGRKDDHGGIRHGEQAEDTQKIIGIEKQNQKQTLTTEDTETTDLTQIRRTLVALR